MSRLLNKLRHATGTDQAATNVYGQPIAQTTTQTFVGQQQAPLGSTWGTGQQSFAGQSLGGQSFGGQSFAQQNVPLASSSFGGAAPLAQSSSFSELPATSTLSAPACGPGCKATYEKPAIVQETFHKSVVEEVQPVINREREQTEIHQIIAPIYQKEERAAIITERSLPAETRPVIFNAPAQDFQLRYDAGLPKSITTEDRVAPQRVMKPAIVQECIKRNIVEEIHPVLHKDIYQPEIIKETLPIYERVVEPPVLIREERAAFTLQPGQALPSFGGQQAQLGSWNQGLSGSNLGTKFDSGLSQGAIPQGTVVGLDVKRTV